MNWTKNPNGGLRIYFFEKPLEFFIFFTLPLEIPDKTKLNPRIFHKIVLDPLEILRPKTKTSGNSTSFLINPWKFYMLFFDTPWKFQILNPPAWIFSGLFHCIVTFCWKSVGKKQSGHGARYWQIYGFFIFCMRNKVKSIVLVVRNTCYAWAISMENLWNGCSDSFRFTFYVWIDYFYDMCSKTFAGMLC